MSLQYFVTATQNGVQQWAINEGWISTIAKGINEKCLRANAATCFHGILPQRRIGSELLHVNIIHLFQN
jgi:hypothetical protein